MEIYVDTANLDEIKEAMEYFPLTGVTCNPSIVKKSANPKDFFDHLKKIRKIISEKKILHVQVVGTDSETQVKEAHELLKVDKDIYVKVPVTYEGLKTIRLLKEEGVKVTATGIYDAMQAYYAIAAGADYIAFYVNRMETNGLDTNSAFLNVQNKLEQENIDCKILAAGFHSVGQIRDAFNCGCESITASFDLMKATFDNQNVKHAIDTFTKDWESMYGKGANLTKMKK